jgi:hypothetical protein
VKSSFAEKVFWMFVVLSSIGAAVYGYERFKLIRPDLFDDGKQAHLSESERAARIAEYQQKGDALTRAATPPPRALKPGETCANGVIVATIRDGSNAEAKAILEAGKVVPCDPATAATIH